MTRTQLLTTLALLSTTLVGCAFDDDAQSDASLRAITIADAWGLRDPVQFPDVATCSDHWAEACAGLEPGQCAIAQNRFQCTQASKGVTISDTFGQPSETLEWTGFSVGDEAASESKDSAQALCETLSGIELAQCLTLAQAAELAAANADALLDKFPQGGFASLTIRDDVFMVEPLEDGGADLVYATADALDWEVPMIAGELALGSAAGSIFEDNVMLSVRPSGSVSVSNTHVALLQKPRPPKQPPPPVSSLVTYKMSHETDNYDNSLTLVAGGWVRYAALWKSYVTGLNVDLIHAYVGGGLLPPLVGAEASLEYHEAHYFTNAQGNTVDPNGTWMSEDIDDPITGLAFAALVMHYWQSPVFFSGNWTPPLSVAPSGSWYFEFALEQISFNIPGANDLHSACGINPNASATLGLAAIQTCNFAGISIDHAVVSAWAGDLSPMNADAMLHHQSISGADLVTAYAIGYSWHQNWPSGRVGELVFDPPAEATPEEIAAVIALAEVMADELRAEASIAALVDAPLE